jgi:hypothetical protein
MTSIERLHRDQLGQLNQIGKGGQARVYLVQGLMVPNERGPFVFKEYKNKRISIGGLDGIAGFRYRLPDYDRAILDTLTNWPQRVVEGAGGGTEGVIIPLIQDDFFHEIRRPDGSRKRLPRDGQYLAQPPKRCARVGLTMVGIGDRYRICRDLALAIGFLHRRDVCVGDISFNNFTYNLGVSPCVYLVDCDAFRLKGQAPVVPQLHTPDWIPPEGSKVQSSRTDEYKLGLFILRVLAPRELSAQNRDPAWADGALDPRGRYLLRKALGTDRTRDRTSPKEWVAYFNDMLKRGALATTRHANRMPPRPAKAA